MGKAQGSAAKGSPIAMLSLYSAVSGFATTPPHGATEMCFCGNYPLTMTPTGGSHAMCLDGNTAYMGSDGKHSVQGDAASLVCPPEYHDKSAEDEVDCSTVLMSGGACGGAEDHGTHDHGTSDTPPAAGVTHVEWCDRDVLLWQLPPDNDPDR